MTSWSDAYRGERGSVVLYLAVIGVGIAGAAAMRRWSRSSARLSAAATVILASVGAVGAGTLLIEFIPDGPLAWFAVVAAAVVAVLLVHGGAWANLHLVDRLRARQRARASDPDLFDRVESWADRHPVRLRRSNILSVVVRSVRRVLDVRITGLAAEMSYYGLISLVPLVTALGAGLGSLERIVGETQVDRIEAGLVRGVSTVFAEDATDDVLTPLIEGLLRDERAGVAIGSIAIALWLASRMFRAAIRALDDAYRVPERRGIVPQWLLGMALALGAVVTLIVLLAIVVVGPLFGNAGELADILGLGAVFEVVWAVLRWPAVAIVCAVYLTILYRYAPNIDTVWTRSVPGAVLGTAGLIGVAIGFGAYVRLAGTSALAVSAEQGSAVTAAAQTIGVILAGVLWLWLSSIVILIGGVLNAELDRERGRELAE